MEVAISGSQIQERHQETLVIPEEEISFSPLSNNDPIGRLFHWKSGIYRGIYPSKTEKIRDLFASGCLEELIRRGLFPQSRLTEYSLEGFGLVVEHENIPFVTYPHEWTFDMLREAALAVLEVIEISARFRWTVTDFNVRNVLFNSNHPMYVDLGGFCPLRKGEQLIAGSDFHKFLKAFWRPLSFWASGNWFLAQRILSSTEVCLPDLSWWLYRHSAFRNLSPGMSARWARRTDRWLRKAAKLLSWTQVLSWIPASLSSRLPVELLTRNPELLRQKFAGLNQPPPSRWEAHHFRYFKAGEPVCTGRAGRILEIIQSLDCESVVELAGRQGAFTLLMAQNTQIRELACTDDSCRSIDQFYSYCRSHAFELADRKLQGAAFNFMQPEGGCRMSSPCERLQADLVVALAITHHLILSQGYAVGEVLQTMASYTRRYALVEFMPSGLATAEKGAGPTPEWYTQDWFHENFAKVFDVIAVKKVEADRVVFVGRVKASS